MMVKDNILNVVLDGENGNLLSPKLLNSLVSDIDRAYEDPNIKGVLITGAGKSFSSGLDISDIFPDSFDWDSRMRVFNTLLYKLFILPKPVVTAINGHAIGGGLLLSCCSDWSCIVNNDKVKIGMPEINLGLTLNDFMLELLLFCVQPLKKLSSVLLTGEYFPPSYAFRIGLTDELCSAEDLLPQATSRLARLADKSKDAFVVTKQRLRSEITAKLKIYIDNY